MVSNKKGGIMLIAILSVITVIIFTVLGTFWNGRVASNETEKAVRSVSLLYLDEMARRRADVVYSSLNNHLEKMQVAIKLLSEHDLSSVENLKVYQSRMKQLYSLEKFAFIDSEGLIYTSLGTKTNINQYPFDYKTLNAPKICVKYLDKEDKKVVIAVPVNNLKLEDKTLIVGFIEMTMNKMLDMVSLQSTHENTTFCNIYTHSGVALTNMILGGLAKENNLLSTMKSADYESGFSYEDFYNNFSSGKKGAVSFTYNGIKETLYFEPIKNTDWSLTYLIRENVISNRISSISDSILKNSLIQSILTLLVLVGMFSYIIAQSKKVAKIALDKEISETENRVKQQELEQRIALQEQLLEKEKQKHRAIR